MLYGKGNITLEQLKELPTPQPLGPRHRPVPFGEFAEEVVHQFTVAGFEVANQEYKVTNEGLRFFGALEVYAPSNLPAIPESRIEVGIRGSHDRSIARGLVFGTKVLVCSNLCFHGDLGEWRTRQTTEVDHRLPGLVAKAVDELVPFVDRVKARFEAWQHTHLTKEEGDQLLVELYRRRALTASQLGKALDEWINPSFDHGDGWTAWRLFNAATEAQKPGGVNSNPFMLEQRTRRVDELFSEQFPVAAEQPLTGELVLAG